MKKYLPHIKPALILTPAIFLLAFWILALSSSGILTTMGAYKLTLWALLLSFGAAYSVAMFVHEILHPNE
ncbi:MAG: hypothetical protein PHE17_21420 [Thiothrix sp.]|uniref:hypothetical protein n=1 Tax=Thiothrix sp. TaxID=1032 RepID=UPI00262FAAF0|nr:hypothetical protein [Thiothrix sp.]MDD5395590.1 hypothetical protein [Thiothrix sp.]